MAFAVNNLRPIGRNSVSGNVIWTYFSTTDTIATIMADNYMSNASSSIALNDVVLCTGTDGVSFGAVNSIVTNNITFKLLDEYTLPTASDIATVNTNLDAGGTLPDLNVQAALDYIVSRVNLKIETMVNIGSGSSIIGDKDTTTDPTAAQQEIRRITGGDSNINVGSSGDGNTIEITAANTLLRDIADTGTGQGLVNSGNSSGSGLIRSLASSDSSLTFGTQNGGTEVNIRIGADSVGSTELEDDGVTSAAIANGAVGSDQLASDSVNTSKIAASAVTATEIAAGAVGSSEIAASAVGSSEIASGAVGSSEIDSSEVQEALANKSNTETGALTVFDESNDTMRRLVPGSGISISLNGEGNIEITSP